MKLTTEELELRLIKHFVTDKTALPRAKQLQITAEHFTTYPVAASTTTYTRSLYDLCVKYFDESGGSLLTELVMENRMIAKSLGEHHRANLVLLWSKVQQEHYDTNDLYELLVSIKEKMAVRLAENLFQEAHATMTAVPDEDNKDRSKRRKVEDCGLSAMVRLIKQRAEDVHAQLQTTTNAPQTIDMQDGGAEFFEQEYRRRKDHPELYAGIRCGMPEIDSQTYGWMPGQLIVVLAPSSGGKSVQLLNWAQHAHQKEGRSVLYLSFELPLDMCVYRHISLAYEVDFGAVKGADLSPEEFSTLLRRMHEEKGGPYFEYDVNLSDPTPDYIESRIQQLTASKGKPDIVIIDYMGVMTVRNPSRDAKSWEKAGEAVIPLVRIAKEYQIPILTAQQINREAIKENRKTKTDNKKNGAAFYQDAASGDQRLMHWAHYAIAIDPDKEHGYMTYYPVKMRDAQFQPFGAIVQPQYNKILPMSLDQRERYAAINGLSGAPLDQSVNSGAAPRSGPTSDFKVTKSAGGVTAVEFSGGVVETTEDELNMDMTDDFLTWGDETL